MRPRSPVMLAVVALLVGGVACKPESRAGADKSPYASADPDSRYRIAERIGLTLSTGRAFMAEVARTPDDKARGLMFRKRMAADEAMVFVYDAPEPLGVWMKNVEFPIDVLFLAKTGAPEKLRVVHQLEGIPPCKTPTCPTYPCPVDVQYFLELPAYTVSSEGLRTGDMVTFEKPP